MLRRSYPQHHGKRMGREQGSTLDTSEGQAVACVDVRNMNLAPEHITGERERREANYIGAVCYSLDRASFNQGINAQYKPQIEEELASALVARGPSAVCYPIDSHQQDSRFKVCADGISPTLPGQMGTGGNNGPDGA